MCVCALFKAVKSHVRQCVCSARHNVCARNAALLCDVCIFAFGRQAAPNRRPSQLRGVQAGGAAALSATPRFTLPPTLAHSQRVQRQAGQLAGKAEDHAEALAVVSAVTKALREGAKVQGAARRGAGCGWGLIAGQRWGRGEASAAAGGRSCSEAWPDGKLATAPPQEGVDSDRAAGPARAQASGKAGGRGPQRHRQAPRKGGGGLAWR